MRAQAAFPGIPHVAVFDTGFHRTLPPEAHTYAVPRGLARRAPRAPLRLPRQLVRLGGAAHGGAARAATPADLRMVVLHLGNGASACAVDGGRSVDTSMGLSPVEGLVMGTRSGDVDPALGGYLARVAGLSAQDYDRALNRESGLLGLAGRLRLPHRSWSVVAAGDPDAALAFDVTVHRLRKYVGRLRRGARRLDALGVHRRHRRAQPRARGRRWSTGWGSSGCGSTRRRTPTGAAGAAGVRRRTARRQVWVVPTDEEREIARATVEVLGLPAL